MLTIDEPSSSSENPTEAVADRILSAFVDAVAAEHGLEAVAQRLQMALLGEKSRSEAAFRDALFGETPE